MRNVIAILIFCFCCLAPKLSLAEQLRLLVPSFLGPKPLSQHVRTTIYFELVKAFQHSDPTDKGAWILYGIDELSAPSHDAVIDACNWPSVHADLAVWGQVYRYDDGVAVQLYLTVSPIIDTRLIRPELWIINVEKNNTNQPNKIEIGIPGRFYEFEPMVLSNDIIMNFDKPEGMPLYEKRKGGKQKGFVGKVILFKEIYDDAIHITTDALDGWVRTESFPKGKSEALSFAKGLVRLLRGDFQGAQVSFSNVLKNENIPQNIRIHSLIYPGLIKEKTGYSGRLEFEEAYQMNKLDKSAASYLLMSEIAQIERTKKNAEKAELKANLKRDLKEVKNLFDKGDQWLQHVEQYLGY